MNYLIVVEDKTRVQRAFYFNQKLIKHHKDIYTAYRQILEYIERAVNEFDLHKPMKVVYVNRPASWFFDHRNNLDPLPNDVWEEVNELDMECFS